MNKAEQRGYLAPKIEVNEVMIEEGIAASDMEAVGGENEPIEW